MRDVLISNDSFEDLNIRALLEGLYLQAFTRWITVLHFNQLKQLTPHEPKISTWLRALSPRATIVA